MAVQKRADAVWNGDLMSGNGTVKGASGAVDVAVNWPKRAEEGEGSTSPEELIAAAHSACYAMALSHGLAQGGNAPEELRVSATVSFQPGEGIKGIHIVVRGEVPGISADDFVKAAEGAKENCPVSKALAATPITLDAALK